MVKKTHLGQSFFTIALALSQQIEAIRQNLKGNILAAQAFEFLSSRHHVRIHALRSAIK